MKFVLDHWPLFLLLLGSGVGLAWPWLTLRQQHLVSPQQAVQWMNRPAGDKALIWDVRSPPEFGNGHIPKAKNIPLPLVSTQLQQLKRPDQVLILVCQAETRARQAAKQARQAGFSRILVLEGGMRALIQAQLPIKTA
jgi:rhodanese-related sulfurtransferase